MEFWHTSRRRLSLEKTLIMAILNVTPDSFSDGGKFFSIDDALRQTEKYISEGADIIDIGGESTRPKAEKISPEEEIRRTIPVIKAVSKRFDVPISIDTSKSEVAGEAVKAGAEIINDVSGLKFDRKIAEIAAREKTGLILMHLRGTFETMHNLPPIENILEEVGNGLSESIKKAKEYGVADNRIALDIGIGFGKTFEQNLELIAKLDKIIKNFPEFPMLVGASRKSFIGKILNGIAPNERIYGSLAAASTAVWNGAKILRVHDVKATVENLTVTEALRMQKNETDKL